MPLYIFWNVPQEKTPVHSRSSSPQIDISTDAYGAKTRGPLPDYELLKWLEAFVGFGFNVLVDGGYDAQTR